MKRSYNSERIRKLVAFIKDNPLMRSSEVAIRMQCDKKYVYYARHRAGVSGVKAKLAYIESLRKDKKYPTKQIPIKLVNPKPLEPMGASAEVTAATIEIARLNTIIKYLEKRLAAYGAPV
jgi:hypothetical protein